MTKIEKLEQEIQTLSAKELSSFRAWFAAFDGAVWDQQIEYDAKAGKLDRLGALSFRASGGDPLVLDRDARGVRSPRRLIG